MKINWWKVLSVVGSVLGFVGPILADIAETKQGDEAFKTEVRLAVKEEMETMKQEGLM